MGELSVDTAAVRLANGRVYAFPRPARHHDILLSLMCDNDLDDCTQGFMDSDGRFIDRQEAWEITEQNGQRIAVHSPGTLFTEDLW